MSLYQRLCERGADVDVPKFLRPAMKWLTAHIALEEFERFRCGGCGEDVVIFRPRSRVIWLVTYAAVSHPNCMMWAIMRTVRGKKLTIARELRRAPAFERRWRYNYGSDPFA